MRYTVLIDGEAGAYGVVFPDLPGCTAMGASVDEALVSAAGAAQAWAAAMQAHQEVVPAPRELSELRSDAEVVEALATGSALGTVTVLHEPGRPVKANLSLGANVLAAIDAAAKRTGRTRSGMIETLAEVGLPLVG